VFILTAFLACGGGGGTRGNLPDQPTGRAWLAAEDRYVPPYGHPELQKALISERAAEVTAEHRVAELEGRATDTAGEDRLRIATADLAVRRRFITMLEICEADGRYCPPRLDDPPWSFDFDADTPIAPPVTAALSFELAGWRALAAELHGRACACRTQACIDSVGVAIDQLERRPEAAVQGDEVASQSVTRARECLFRLRGRAGAIR